MLHWFIPCGARRLRRPSPASSWLRHSRTTIGGYNRTSSWGTKTAVSQSVSARHMQSVKTVTWSATGKWSHLRSQQYVWLPVTPMFCLTNPGNVWAVIDTHYMSRKNTPAGEARMLHCLTHKWLHDSFNLVIYNMGKWERTPHVCHYLYFPHHFRWLSLENWAALNCGWKHKHSKGTS